MAAALLSLADVALTFGGTPLLTGAELSVAAGDRVVLVGRNGSGKSTLLKIAAGLIEPDRGERFVQPGTLVRYLPQETDLAGFETTLAAVEAGLAPTGAAHQASRLLADLGLGGNEAPSQLSGGEARRVAIAQALVADPDVLLLDEPTNHLDLPAIEWLEGVLGQSRAAIVLISHDRRFLEALSRRTVWLDRGVTRQLDQGFAAFEAWRDDELAREEAEWHKLDRKIAREQSWMHGGVTARRKRNVRRVSELAAMRQARRDRRRVEGKVEMAAAGADTSGRLVIEASDISKAFAGRPIVTGLSLRVLRGDRLGIVGANGTGKTTLLSLLTGRLAPDAGTVRLGSGIEMVTLDQQRASLAPDMTVSDALTGGRGDSLVINGRSRHVVSYMKDFLFAAEQARTPLKALSGGERGRVMLARALSQPSNLLVLDEPTNDLDLETLDLLQELLSDYAGTLLLVSHDRDFLDRVVTSVVAAEGEGRWVEYAGGYSDMLAQRGGRDLAAKAARTAAREIARERAATADAAQPAAPTRQRKLSFKEKHLLDTLPRTLDALAAAIKGLEARLADPGLYGRDRPGFEAVTRDLTEAQARLAAAEDEWLRLETMREEMGG